MGLLGCGQEKGMQSAQRGRGQGLAAAQPTMELFIPLHFTILLCLCLLLLGPCSWLALHVLLLVPISSTIFVILILPVTSLVLLSVACLELPQPGAWEDALEQRLCGTARWQRWRRCQRPRWRRIVCCPHCNGYVKHRGDLPQRSCSCPGSPASPERSTRRGACHPSPRRLLLQAKAGRTGRSQRQRLGVWQMAGTPRSEHVPLHPHRLPAPSRTPRDARCSSTRPSG
nr:uncharacterized protein LOC106044800 isoform X2 [Anser cygnoides]